MGQGHDRGRQADKTGKRDKKGERELCLAATFKGCTCSIADGHLEAGDDVAASEAKTGCCRRWN